MKAKSKKSTYYSNSETLWLALDKNEKGFLNVIQFGDSKNKPTENFYEKDGKKYPILQNIQAKYDMVDNKISFIVERKIFYVSQKTLKSFGKDLAEFEKLNFAEKCKYFTAEIWLRNGQWGIADLYIKDKSVKDTDLKNLD